MTTITVRQATKQDLSAVKELWKEMMDFHQVRDPFFTRSENGHKQFGAFVAENIDSDDWLMLIATDGDQVIGYGIATIMAYPPVYVNPRYGFVQDVAVTEAYRGRGVGRQIFERMEAWFREKGMSRLELEVVVTNEVSQAFWKQIGFRDFMKKLTMDL